MASVQKPKAGGIVTPEELKKVQDEKDSAAAREAMEKMRRVEQEQQGLHDAFMKRKIGPEAIDRFNAAVKKAAEQGQHEIMIGQFPASWCSDGGRRINNNLEDWPDSLEGIAKEVYEYHVKNLAPLGYKMRVEVLNYPGGVPGDIGIFFRW
jgi:hypothetical protein